MYPPLASSAFLPLIPTTGDDEAQEADYKSKETETIGSWLRDVRDSKINKYRYKRLG